jgi:glutaconate CoA-transferase, subunit B
MSFSLDEWFVVALARTIRDQEVVFHGFGSPCAQVAMHLAKRTHARNMLLIEGATYAVDPSPPFLHRRLGQHQRDRHRAVGAAQGEARRRRGWLQPRRHGAAHLTLWTTRHRGGRTLVSECDFVTDMGHRTRAGSRRELGFTGAGPEWLVTELGVFDFDGDGHARLRQLLPDVTLDEVRAATAFELRVAADLRRPLAPSDREVAAVRSLDPLGVRRLEFSEQDLSRHFRFGRGDAACAC